MATQCVLYKVGRLEEELAQVKAIRVVRRNAQILDFRMLVINL